MPNQPIPPPGATAVGSAASKHGTILPSASYGTGATNSEAMFNPRGDAIRLFINTTVVGAGPGTVVVKVQIQDPVSLGWFDLPGATTATINSNTLTVLTVEPSLTVVANAAISQVAPGGIWRIVATVGTNAVTFSVSGEYIENR